MKSTFRKLDAHILVHDYAGHPFTVELARGLALRGIRVTYAYFAGDGGPKGRNKPLADDPKNFNIVPVSIPFDYSKTNLWKRRQGDIAYGRAIAAVVREIRPDIVISVSPPERQEYLLTAIDSVGGKAIIWCQDFYSIAAKKILSRKLPGIGHLVGAYYTFLERRQMRNAAHVVHITDSFTKVTDGWGIPRARVSVIPNWGALNEIPMLPHETDWARRNGLKRAQRVVYSGTLALKHNPEFLAQLAHESGSDVDVVVVGFGVGVDKLQSQKAALPNLTLLPLQSFAEFPQVLASADVLVAVTEADAGIFSVPSKVLSYLCAGRPIVLASPADNLAARILTETGAGIVVAPDDRTGFVDAIKTLLTDSDLRAAMGLKGRAYAEKTFDLGGVMDRFESVFADVLDTPLTLPRSLSTSGIDIEDPNLEQKI